MKDKARYLVLIEGYYGFVPISEMFKVHNKRNALKLKRRLMKRKDIQHKKIRIVKDGIAKEIEEEILPFGYYAK